MNFVERYSKSTGPIPFYRHLPRSFYMFSFPVNTASNLIRDNIGSQVSFLLNLSKSFVNASMQLGELNVQAGSKLMEESTTAMTKGMQLRTLVDTQLFLAEQSQVTVERISGYTQNVQNIVTMNMFSIGNKSGGFPAASQPTRTEHANESASRQETAPHGQHETDPHPSALVEKLVASAVNDIDKLH
jgi:hypothetical protein